MKIFRGQLESACLSIHVSVCPSVCVQNTGVCQSAGGGIKSHLDSSRFFWSDMEELVIFCYSRYDSPFRRTM